MKVDFTRYENKYNPIVFVIKQEVYSEYIFSVTNDTTILKIAKKIIVIRFQQFLQVS